jgi:ABC-2 type transport system permease protein
MRTFLVRELRLWMHFRSSFTLDQLMVLTNFTIYMVMASFQRIGPGLEAYGSDFTSFVVVGLAANTVFAAALAAPYLGLLASWQANRLELLMLSPINLPLFIAGISLGQYLRAAFRVAIYLVLGILVFGAGQGWSLRIDGLLAGLAASILAVAASMGLGLAAAAMIYFVDARGGSDPVRLVVEAVAGIAAGVYFPVSFLPQWLQWLACAVPHTYALDTLRRGLAGMSPLPTLPVHGVLPGSPVEVNLFVLAVYAILSALLGLGLFRRGLELARTDGRLSTWR